MSVVNPRAMRLDPFFDQATIGQADQATPPAPPPPGYLDPDRVMVGDERTTVGQVVRTGPAGLRGLIVPPATMGGIPRGTRPHDIRGVTVTIDPHIPNQSSQLRLGDITPDRLRDAMAVAEEVTPEPQDIATLRLRGAATMHGIGAAAAAGGGAGRIVDTNPTAAQDQQRTTTVNAPNLAQHGQIRRSVRPLAAFGQAPPNSYEGRELRHIDMPAAPREVGCPPPGIRVTFEIEHFGTHDANYHDVIIQEGFMVLAFRTDYTGGSRYFPPQKPDSPPMAINVAGTADVYLVHATGIQFVHGNMEYAVLAVDQVGAMPNEG